MSARCCPGTVKALGADPILYSFRRCPYAMRARLALAVSGVRHERREDRGIFFVNTGPQTRTFSYKVRAATRGRFVLPSATAEKYSAL